MTHSIQRAPTGTDSLYMMFLHISHFHVSIVCDATSDWRLLEAFGSQLEVNCALLRHVCGTYEPIPTFFPDNAKLSSLQILIIRNLGLRRADIMQFFQLLDISWARRHLTTAISTPKTLNIYQAYSGRPFTLVSSVSFLFVLDPGRFTHCLSSTLFFLPCFRLYYCCYQL